MSLKYEPSSKPLRISVKQHPPPTARSVPSTALLLNGSSPNRNLFPAFDDEARARFATGKTHPFADTTGKTHPFADTPHANNRSFADVLSQNLETPPETHLLEDMTANKRFFLDVTPLQRRMDAHPNRCLRPVTVGLWLKPLTLSHET